MMNSPEAITPSKDLDMFLATELSLLSPSCSVLQRSSQLLVRTPSFSS